MQPIYSNTAAAIFLNREAAISALRQRASTLLETDPNVCSVVLFGSLARGDATARSDADLLVLLRRARGGWVDRVPRYIRAFEGLGLDLDVFPFSRDEWESRLHSRDPFAESTVDACLLLAGEPLIAIHDPGNG